MRRIPGTQKKRSLENYTEVSLFVGSLSVRRNPQRDMRACFIKGDVHEKTSKKMLSQSEIQKKMATEAAAAAEKLAAKKAAKVEEARKRAAAAAAKQAATDKLLEETFEHVMAQAVEEQPKLRGAWAAKAKLRRAIAMEDYIPGFSKAADEVRCEELVVGREAVCVGREGVFVAGMKPVCCKLLAKTGCKFAASVIVSGGEVATL